MDTTVRGIKTKSRSISPVKVGPFYDLVYDANHTLNSQSLVPQFTVGTSGERITYSTSRADARSKSNFCEHVRETFAYGGGSSPIILNGTGGQADWETHYHSHHRHACDSLAAVKSAVLTAFSPNGVEYVSANAMGAINDTYYRVRPDLTTVSIPNFLIDITQIKSLFQLWKKRLSFQRNLAGAHLNYNFGWKPTIGDLQNVLEAVTGLQRKLREFQNSLDVTFKGQTTINSGSDNVSGSVVYPSGNHRAHYNAAIERRLTGSLAWRPVPLQALGGLDISLRAIADSLGFELNPRIVWDALPLSFVVDWFFDVGSFLGRFKIDTLELPIHLVDGYVQYEETIHCTYHWLRADDGIYQVRPASGPVTWTRHIFKRIPIFPDRSLLSAGGYKFPSLKQASLGISLATVLRRR